MMGAAGPCPPLRPRVAARVKTGARGLLPLLLQTPSSSAWSGGCSPKPKEVPALQIIENINAMVNGPCATTLYWPDQWSFDQTMITFAISIVYIVGKGRFGICEEMFFCGFLVKCCGQAIVLTVYLMLWARSNGGWKIIGWGLLIIIMPHPYYLLLMIVFLAPPKFFTLWCRH